MMLATIAHLICDYHFYFCFLISSTFLYVVGFELVIWSIERRHFQ